MAFLKYAIQDGKPIPHSDVEHTGGGKSQTRKEPGDTSKGQYIPLFGGHGRRKVKEFYGTGTNKKKTDFFF